MTPIRKLIIVSAVLAVMFGCRKSEPEPAASNRAGTQASYASGSAQIHGKVVLVGKAPVMGTIANQPCHEGAGPLTEETVVAGAGGGLRNVIVYLEDAPAAPPPDAGMPPVKLDQVNCRYAPHVVGVRAGQTLRVSSSDPTLHNVHGMCFDNPAFNFALVGSRQFKDLAFDAAERFPIRCDVHPWMKAYVQVFSHPWFAVTDENGTFEVRNVPAGSYTLVAWQEKYGLLRVRITVQDGKVAKQDFEFKSGL